MSLVRTRSGALSLVALTTLTLGVVWAAWLWMVERTDPDAVHVFQYALVLIIAAGVCAVVEPPSAAPLLGLAVLASVGVWVGLENPQGVAVALLVMVVAATAYGIARRSRPAIVLAVAGILVSVVGWGMIL